MIVMSKQQLKLYANSLLTMISLVLIGVMLIAFARPGFVNKVGNLSISVYERAYKSDAKEARGQLTYGKTDDAVKLLQSSKWGDVLLDDRPYYLKREVLRSLCGVFYLNKEYDKLLYWATVWRGLDDRDVDAMAFWYEGLRHTPDRRRKGIKGLTEGQKLFPENILFQRLYFQYLDQSGEPLPDQFIILNKQKLIIQNILKGWELRWRWKLRHALAEPIEDLRQNVTNQQWTKAGHALFSVVQLFRFWAADEYLKQKGYAAFSIFPDTDDWMHIRAEVPRQTSTLRIDFPPFSSATISEFKLTIDGKQVSISDDWIEYVNVFAEQGTIKTGGFEDSHFILNISSLDRLGDSRAMRVNIKFKLLISDLFGNSKILSHKVALD